jgi:hypothetical protein
MFALKAGVLPDLKPCAYLARLAALASLSAMAGCADTNRYSSENAAIAPQHLAEANGAPTPVAEDDGRPAQALPTTRIRQLPDDVKEPFSPNYGGQNPSKEKRPESIKAATPVVPVRAAGADIPTDLPPAFRKKLAAAMAADE